MKLKFWEDTPSIYDEQIATVLTAMSEYGPESPEYPALLTTVKELQKLKAEEKPKFRVKPDTLAVVVGNLVGIGIIVWYEQAHAMTSKGLHYVKPQTPTDI